MSQKDKNDSHRLFCCKIAFVAFFCVYFSQQMSAFYEGESSTKAGIVCFFLHEGFPKFRIYQYCSRSCDISEKIVLLTDKTWL